MKHDEEACDRLILDQADEIFLLRHRNDELITERDYVRQERDALHRTIAQVEVALRSARALVYPAAPPEELAKYLINWANFLHELRQGEPSV